MKAGNVLYRAVKVRARAYRPQTLKTSKCNFKYDDAHQENRRNPAGRPAGRPAYIIKAGRPSSVFHILEIYYKEGSIRANAYALETRLIASSTLIQTTLLWWGTSQFVTYFEIWPPEGSKRNLRLGAGFFLGAPFNSATYYAKISKSLKKPGTARGLVRCELSICVVCYCNDKILCRDSFGFCSNKLKNYVFKITNSSAKIDYRTQLKC